MSISGCFPALKTVQPRVELTVTDSNGKALEGANFTLATFRQPFPIVDPLMRASYRTDQDGTFALRKRRKWVWQVLLPDGVTWYTWAYCVEKPGYRAMAQTTPAFDAPITLVLEDSQSASQCVWPNGDDTYRQVRTTDDVSPPSAERP